MKKLYEVTVTYYVMAESEDEAECVDTLHGDTTKEVERATSVDELWWHAIPFGGDDDRTCGVILQAEREAGTV
jgi:hypothetical protein